ncbi:MAG: PT domain-containing protein [Candidatus Aenigmarchaeota archaeon]|nr:PT domain-containing protein [Candidatus Aenigmarchaeota archaeon]
MSLPIIDGNTEKTDENIYNRIKHEISLHPKASIASLLTAAGLTGAVSFLQTKNPDDLGSIPQAGSRVFQLYSPEIIANSMNAFDSVAKGLSESGAGQILNDEGISGLTKYFHLACAGLIQGAEGYGKKEKTVTRKEVDFNKEKEDKHGHGLLYVGGVLAFACLGGATYYLSNIGEGSGTPPQSTGIDPASDPIIPVETDTPDATPTVEATEEPTVEPIQEPTATATQETHWYDGRPHYIPTVIKADENLFGIEIEGIKYDKNDAIGYQMFDENENIIFKHSNCLNFDIYSELLPGQGPAIEAEYGSMVSLTIEQIDTDGGGMDKVAVQYVGSKTWTFESAYHAGWGVEDYIYMELIK